MDARKAKKRVKNLFSYLMALVLVLTSGYNGIRAYAVESGMNLAGETVSDGDVMGCIQVKRIHPFGFIDIERFYH